MKAALPPGSTIGIIGGGQLGRMLAMAGARLGYHAIILDPDPTCPAAEVAGGHIVAPYDDHAALDRLAGACAVVTYEFENVPVEGVRLLEGRMAAWPGSRALEVAQDRVTEKTFLNAIGIETARFAAIDDAQDAVAALGNFPAGGVLKTRRFGYDGKGQAVLRPGDDAAAAFAALGAQPAILEEMIAFDCEISVVAARSVDGRVAAYDPARNEHSGGILRRSTVPSGVSREIEAQARRNAFAILEALDYVGVIGVEFFVAGDRLLVNEIAPRVHNSGHWTEAACFVSQFELHMRAVAGLPLGGTERHSDCVMENLIGDEIDRAGALAGEPRVVLNIYGKAETRPGRKMGHFTRLTGPVPTPAG
jgi:5-(carboxyamino)imidazole ribonucleotide synthase